MGLETKAAWNSDLLGYKCPESSSELEGCYVQLRTNRASFTRALVVKETRETLTLRYVEKTDLKENRPVTRTENIRKVDIESIQVFKD